jgi:serine/threonine protein kinase/formylglycine-generating enzyme required for sulfatase activity
MDRERFLRMRELFGAALELAPGQRAPFLQEACGGDEELLAAVERLLLIEQGAGNFLEGPVPVIIPTDTAASRLLGQRIGRYRILGILSEGGMGVVYEALQERPERIVALKVIRQGIISRSAARRFEYEGQVLARLHHPHIAQIIEVGTHVEGEAEGSGAGAASSAVGLPYLVMEYIAEARTITDYARERDLSTRARLDLFMQVLEAVDHGHRQGVIHRDLKPSNILVDGEGRVKVIDFGVARATGSDLTAATVVTEAGQLIGTLQYMSPEQCEVDAREVDTRSDVYALGMVLYELLCEELPYDVEQAALFEALRLIREEPPRRPSTIRRALRGDVETIVLMALEKERGRRYQSVSELRGDIRRYLQGEVILARPAGPLRRTWKWVKRNPVVGSTTAVALLALLVMVGLRLFWSQPRIEAEARRLVETNEKVLRLSDLKVLQDLQSEADQLWPAFPEKIPEIDDWIARADSLISHLPVHETVLMQLKAGARLAPLDLTSAIREPTERDMVWIFEDLETKWWHGALASLVEGLMSFADPDTGLKSNVEARLAFAVSLEEGMAAHEPDWNRAIASISDPDSCPEYDGLKIEPITGLVPIGRDPDCGLWEFAHLQTGDVPRRNEQGRLVLTEGTGLVFVLIPGGSFLLGENPPNIAEYDRYRMPSMAPTDGVGYPEPRQVPVEPFLLSKYEMTQGQWLRVTGENPSVRHPGKPHNTLWTTLLHPVEAVSWNDCSQVLGQMNLRLPEEAEWEYATRAGTHTIWWTGNEPESLIGAANLRDQTCARYGSTNTPPEPWDDGFALHAPVGSLRPNGFGLHDVCGNVYEWCNDAYVTPGSSSVSNGVTRSTGSMDERRRPRIHRGSSWLHFALQCQSAYRDALGATNEYQDIGVRPAASLP